MIAKFIFGFLKQSVRVAISRGFDRPRQFLFLDDVKPPTYKQSACIFSQKLDHGSTIPGRQLRLVVLPFFIGTCVNLGRCLK